MNPGGVKNRSSRGAHRQGVQTRMDLMAALEVPEAKPERIKDSIYTLFDDDFDPSIKGIKDWILEVYAALSSYWKRNSKVEELFRKNLQFHHGMEYLVTILLSELTATQGKEIADRIVEDLGPLLQMRCADCQKKLEVEDEIQTTK